MHLCRYCKNEVPSYKRDKRFCSIECEKIENDIYSKIYDANNEKLSSIIKTIPQSNYVVDIEIYKIEDAFARYAESYDGFEYNPDFQRGFVWTKEQKIKFIESLVSNNLGSSQKTITLNCPGFDNIAANDSDLKGFCIVDGLQRITALIEFTKGEFLIFGKLSHTDLLDSKFSIKRKTIKVQIFSFDYKKDLLNYYLSINDGGTVHSKDELDRVKQLLNNIK